MISDLEKLGLDAARQVAGESAIEDVSVEPGTDAVGQPAYTFSFLIDEQRMRVRLGLFLIKVFQELCDKLEARGDNHFPQIQLMSKTDWDKRARA